MLEKLLTPLTTASSVGVAIRYLTTIAGSVIAILGILGWLTPEQSDALTKQVPEVLAAMGALIAAAVPLYAIVTKSFSDKAAEAAKKIDKEIPPAATVVIETPGSGPNIYVDPK